MSAADSSSIMPGGGISRRPLDFFVLADCSGSMRGEKMQALNFAIADMLPHLATWERDQEQAAMRIRAVAFGDEAVWHVAEPTPVGELRWPPLQAAGRTRMGRALEVVGGALNQLERRALRPAVILITDGRPTDDFDAGLAALLATPAGRSALSLAVAIGRDADLDPLERFIGDPSVPVLVADSAEEIADRLIAASIAVSRLSEVRLGQGHDVNAKGVLAVRGPGSVADDDRIV
jgi:uncharacterized protein YegL